MDDFERHSARIGKFMIMALVAKLAVVGGLIWLAVYAINAFTA